MKDQDAMQHEMTTAEFKRAGYKLVDFLSLYFDTIQERAVTSAEQPGQIHKILGNGSLPETGSSVSETIDKACDLLFPHSLFNGHPKFFGYITGSPLQAGVFAEMIATAINPNLGANILSPMATAIERQTIAWMCEFIGVSPAWGGILVSGGNMANFTAFLAARTAKTSNSLKEKGLMHMQNELTMYCSRTTHTWIEKAAVLFGHGANAIRWIPTNDDQRMNNKILRNKIEEDLKGGMKPFLVVGTAGDVSTGAVDDLAEIAALCRENDLWFHIDGAYGMPATVVPECKSLFDGFADADSIAMDPHKWLYAPLEAGCTLVKNPQHLLDTFSAHPVYFNFSNSDDEPAFNFYEYGFQNSRGFRALKVWMAFQHLGRSGYIKLIRKDIELARLLFKMAEENNELEPITHNLSITTFRYVPAGVNSDASNESYLNALNEKLLNRLQNGGEVFLSNAMVSGKYCLRACMVNFRTTQNDILETVKIVVREGRKIHETK